MAYFDGHVKARVGGDKKIKKVMGEYKHGTLHSGSKTGPKVNSRQQALAIAFSETQERKRR